MTTGKKESPNFIKYEESLCLFEILPQYVYAFVVDLKNNQDGNRQKLSWCLQHTATLCVRYMQITSYEWIFCSYLNFKRTKMETLWRTAAAETQIFQSPVFQNRILMIEAAPSVEETHNFVQQSRRNSTLFALNTRWPFYQSKSHQKRS